MAYLKVRPDKLGDTRAKVALPIGEAQTLIMEPRFAREIEAITRRMEAKILVVVDHQVRRGDFFEPGRSSLQELRLQGGGGPTTPPC